MKSEAHEILFMLLVIQNNVLCVCPSGLDFLQLSSHEKEEDKNTVFIVSALVQTFITALKTGGDLLLSSGTFYFTASRRDDDY